MSAISYQGSRAAESQRRASRGQQRAGLRQLGAGVCLAIAGAATTLWLWSIAAGQVAAKVHWLPDDAAALALLAFGGMLAAWYAVTGIGIALAPLSRRGLGTTRWGAPFARRLATSAAVLWVVNPGTALAAGEAPIPDDLTWGGIAYSAVVPELSSAETPRKAEAPTLGRVREPVLNGGAIPSPTAQPAAAASGSQSDAPVPTGATGNTSDTGGTYGTSQSAQDQSAPASELAPEPAPEPAPADAAPLPELHTVQRGESLWRIAAAELGNGSSNATVAVRVQEWIAANPELAANPDLILVGQEIVRPEGIS